MRSNKRRRSKSASKSIRSDVFYMCSRLPPLRALAAGLLLFCLFYFLLPILMDANVMNTPAGEAIWAKKIRLLKKIGVFCGFVGLFFCVTGFIYQLFSKR